MKHLRMMIIPALMLLMLSSAAAQDGFVVMSLKGKVEARKPGKKSAWELVKVGDVLGKSMTVRTSFASYVKLMMEQNRLLSIDEKTTKKLSDFVKSRDGNGSTSGTLLAYAAKQMKNTRAKRGEPILGAVRGNTDVFSAVFPKYYVMTTEPLFEWVDADEAMKYEFVLLNDSFDVVTRATLTDNSFRYDGGEKPALESDRQYHWRITRLSDGMESDIQSFRILPADTIAAVNQELQRLDAELTGMGADEVTLHLIRAIYFEKKSLYTNAFLEYKETVRLAPDVDEYRQMLRNLLFQMKLYAEEDYLLK
ncbi:MAG: hypothetical protein IH600_10625 [Bacteroidetes bacterium]|nr:hypothetical protein [Bacteroidota bacterium]